MQNRSILTFNSHEAYVYALSRTNLSLDVIDQLPGRYVNSWDTKIRPIPDNIRLITLKEAELSKKKYDCAIAYSIDDLLMIKNLEIPKILTIHISLTGYIEQEGNKVSPEKACNVLNTYLKKIGVLVVSISEMKQKTWGVSGPIIRPFIDTEYFNGYNGKLAVGLRVGNQLVNKGQLLYWDFFQAVITEYPVKILGYNPDLKNVTRAQDLNDLRQHYQTHRFYIHTSKYDFEDGYNMASLEAMACGMPIVCNQHPTSPIINGMNGFMSNDVDELRAWIEMLLMDLSLAQKMGIAAREWVLDNNSLDDFRTNWQGAVEEAIALFGKFN